MSSKEEFAIVSNFNMQKIMHSWTEYDKVLAFVSRVFNKKAAT